MKNVKKIILGFDEFSSLVLNEAKNKENTMPKQAPKAEVSNKDNAPRVSGGISVKLKNGQVGLQSTLDLIEQTCGGRDWKAVTEFLKKSYPDVEVNDDFVAGYIDDMIRQTNIGQRSYVEEGPDSLMLLVLRLVIISLLMFPSQQDDLKGKVYDGSIVAIIDEEEFD